MNADLRDALADRLDPVVAPVGDLAAVMRHGRRLRARRRATLAGSVAVLLVIGGVAATQWLGSPDPDAADGQVATQRAVATSGLQAYADPGGALHFGGRLVVANALSYLDTDATATANGVVYYDAGRPMLLGLDGASNPFVGGQVQDPPEFHPTAKADSTTSQVAVGIWRGGQAHLLVIDAKTRELIDQVSVVCDGCGPVVIEAFDDDAVFFRDGNGTSVWDLKGRFIRPFAGPETAIADVRNGVVLYDGPLPLPEPGEGERTYRFVPGAIDAQLTHDGAHVLSWSSTLAPTVGGAPLHLSVTEQDGATHWTIDTDGSVLVASRAGNLTRIDDCDAVTGACERVGELEVTGGDLMFLGNDM